MHNLLVFITLDWFKIGWKCEINLIWNVFKVWLDPNLVCGWDMETYMFLSSKCHIPRSNLNLKRAPKGFKAVETQELRGALPPWPPPGPLSGPLDPMPLVFRFLVLVTWQVCVLDIFSKARDHNWCWSSSFTILLYPRHGTPSHIPEWWEGHIFVKSLSLYCASNKSISVT